MFGGGRARERCFLPLTEDFNTDFAYLFAYLQYVILKKVYLTGSIFYQEVYFIRKYILSLCCGRKKKTIFSPLGVLIVNLLIHPLVCYQYQRLASLLFYYVGLRALEDKEVERKAKELAEKETAELRKKELAAIELRTKQLKSEEEKLEKDRAEKEKLLKANKQLQEQANNKVIINIHYFLYYLMVFIVSLEVLIYGIVSSSEYMVN